MRELRLKAALEALRNCDRPLPPSEIGTVGDGSYTEIAAEFLAYFVSVGELAPEHFVLDIGSGTGRMAAGLRYYLDPVNGRYAGFDPVPAAVDWCRSSFADTPSFQFEWANVFNELYAPDGLLLATEYEFPAPDASVDFVIATSVFTHLYEAEIEAYLRQIRRVLKPGGRMFATAYLVPASGPPEGGPVHLRFSAQAAGAPHCWHVPGYPPLAAVAYGDDHFASLCSAELGRPVTIRPGRWRGGEGPWFQDVIMS